MHILIIPSWYSSPKQPNSGVFFREQAHALLREGHKVGVLAPTLHSLRNFGSLGGMRWGISFENDAGIPTYRSNDYGWFWRIPYANDYWWRLHGARLYRRYALEHGTPDIIHVHSALPGGLLAIYLKEEFSIPFVLTEHSSGYAYRWFGYRRLRLAEKIFLSAARLICVSPKFGDLLRAEFPTTNQRWMWIPNIVHHRFLEHPLTARPTSGASIIFLNIAQNIPGKGQRELLTAFSNVIRHGMMAELWLGGDGPIRLELERYARELQIEAHVKFLGMLDREGVKDAMQASNVFVLSSHYETFGVVLIEALALGLPVVATRCGGPDCIVTERNGLLVQPGDVKELEEAMHAVGSQLASYDAEEIRDDCRQRFGSASVVAQLSDVYRSVIAAIG